MKMFYSRKLTPNGICFWSAAPFPSLARGLKGFRLPSGPREPHALSQGSGAVLEVLSFGVPRASGRGAPCPAEL